MTEDEKAYGRGQVIEIITTVINKFNGSSDDLRVMYEHISSLAQTIDRLKKEIASSQTYNVKHSHVPDALDELDAVIDSTAEATNAIMAACEEIEHVGSTLSSEQAAELSDKVTKIYEACSFQDITGQRIRKVVSTLKEIETKIDSLLKTLDMSVGPVPHDESPPNAKVVSIEDEKSLLNGPQMADKAISQDDIDRLLAEFDSK